MTVDTCWSRYRDHAREFAALGLTIDVSRMLFDEVSVGALNEPLRAANGSMAALEQGEKANRSEDRLVGHYWLRAPELAPNEEIRLGIATTVDRTKRFAADVHAGIITPQQGDGFFVALVIGIGGSALGAQWVCDALSTPDDQMIIRFIDNTDPAGIDRVLEELGDDLQNALTIVVSKSGGTRETLNGLDEVAKAYVDAGLTFGKHAVAVTQPGSKLAERARAEGWLDVFAMWDWVGGRTSVTSAAGLLPAALVGVDIDSLLDGARACDVATRVPSMFENPAALLAVMWHMAGAGRGDRHMVVQPYRDQLLFLPRYLQQLVMESIGKAHTRSGAPIEQGLTVFGNKGSTDQHALMQQLRDGRNDFFVLFVRVLRDRQGSSSLLERGATAGDYLDAMWQGTREALSENERQSVTLTLDRLDAHRVGVLIALFERAVGLYGELIDVNAYDQPGVEAGKRAADAVIGLQASAIEYLRGQQNKALSADEIASGLDRIEDTERIFHVLRHAAANPDHRIIADVPEVGVASRFRAR